MMKKAEIGCRALWIARLAICFGARTGRNWANAVRRAAFASALLLVAAPAVADPDIVSDPPLVVDEGEAYSYTIVVRDDDDDDDDDDDTDRFEISVTSTLPPWLAFDGERTLSGTPGAEDSGKYPISIEARRRRDRDTQKFTITVRDVPPTPEPPPPPTPPSADLEATIAVSPNPTLAGLPAGWTLTVRNVADAYVANIDLHARFSGDGPLDLELVASPSCTLQPSGNEAELDCRIGPLAGGQAQSIEILSTSSEAGEVVGVATVSIADTVPLDGVAGNNQASASLTVASQLSSGAAQQLDAPGGSALASGDLNGDGYEDIAVATHFGERTLIFLNGRVPNDDNKRAFVTAPLRFGTASTGSDIAAADLDGDGHIDLVVANADTNNQVLINDGSGGFSVIALSGSSAPSNAVALGDINGDGLGDIVFANAGADTVYLNQGGRAFTRSASLGEPQANSVAVAIVDLLGDARPELVFANPAGDAAVYQSSGASIVLAAMLSTGPTTGVSAADFDGDGRLDLVFARSADATRPASKLVYLNRSTTVPVMLLADEFGGSSTVDLVVDDVDLDGLDDVVSINAVGSHQLYKNSSLSGSVSFLLHPEQFGRDGAAASVAGKFNPDDRVDIAIVGANRISIFLNDGRGNLGVGDVDRPTLTLVGSQTVVISVGTPYVDAGATAMDVIDGNLTAAIEVDNQVDSDVIGTYTVHYNVVDSSGNAASPVNRTVQVEEGTESGSGGGAVSIEMLLLLLAAASLFVSLPVRQR
jgi:hypothetical protein